MNENDACYRQFFYLAESHLKPLGQINFLQGEINCVDFTDEETLPIVSGFHAQQIERLNIGDLYHCGLRANHFVFEFGYSELSSGTILLVTANHKGTRITKVFRLADGFEDKILGQFDPSARLEKNLQFFNEATNETN